MIEFDNIKVENLPVVLNEDTTLKRYYPLVKIKDVIVKELLAAGVMDKYDFLDKYKEHLELVKTKTGLSTDILALLASFFTYQNFKERKLKELDCISEKYILLLKDSGIKTSSQILCKFKCHEEILRASEKYDIPYLEMHKIVCLCDLMRLPGVKCVRAELYFNCNIRNIADMAKQDLINIKQCICNYIEETNSKRAVPLNKELNTQIAWAKVMPVVLKIN